MKIVQDVRALRRLATKMTEQVKSIDVKADIRQSAQTLVVITDRLVEATGRAFSVATGAEPVRRGLALVGLSLASLWGVAANAPLPVVCGVARDGATWP